MWKQQNDYPHSRIGYEGGPDQTLCVVNHQKRDERDNHTSPALLLLSPAGGWIVMDDTWAHMLYITFDLHTWHTILPSPQYLRTIPKSAHQVLEEIYSLLNLPVACPPTQNSVQTTAVQHTCADKLVAVSTNRAKVPLQHGAFPYAVVYILSLSMNAKGGSYNVEQQLTVPQMEYDNFLKTVFYLYQGFNNSIWLWDEWGSAHNTMNGHNWSSHTLHPQCGDCIAHLPMIGKRLAMCNDCPSKYMTSLPLDPSIIDPDCASIPNCQFLTHTGLLFIEHTQLFTMQTQQRLSKEIFSEQQWTSVAYDFSGFRILRDGVNAVFGSIFTLVMFCIFALCICYFRPRRRRTPWIELMQFN